MADNRQKEETFVFQFMTLGGQFLFLLGIAAVSLGTVFISYILTDLTFMILGKSVVIEGLDFGRIWSGLILVIGGFISIYAGMFLCNLKLINAMERKMRQPLSDRSPGTNIGNLAKNHY